MSCSDLSDIFKSGQSVQRHSTPKLLTIIVVLPCFLCYQKDLETMQLDCIAQNYAWGIKGDQSAVARFKRASDANFEISSTECYAELWYGSQNSQLFHSFTFKVEPYLLWLCRMGTHPSGPSKVAQDGALLMDWLADKPHSVGVVPEEYPSNNLPFLFKVLSVRTALSVQVTVNTVPAFYERRQYCRLVYRTFPSYIRRHIRTRSSLNSSTKSFLLFIKIPITSLRW